MIVLKRLKRGQRMQNSHHLTELKRGTILIAVLSQMKQAVYGYDLVRVLNDAGYVIEQNTLYPMLRRLEKQGIITHEMMRVDNRDRKYYSLTKDGYELYQELVQVLNETNVVLNRLIGGSDDIN